MRSGTVLAAALLSAALGCGERERTRPAARDPLQLGPDVVSVVDGTAIRARELAQLMEAGGLERAAALRRLESLQLLAAEATRRGYAERDQTQQVARQALVQALLERDVEIEHPSEAEVSAAYEKERARFETPEKRTSSHVLAFLPEGASAEQEQAAHAFITAAASQLRVAPDSAAGLETLKTAHPPGVALKVEDLPEVTQDGFVPEFSRALFALTAPGAVSAPVRTSFGWHVIVLRAITPAKYVDPALARRDLRRELAAQKHQQRLDSLLTGLRDRTQVRYSDDTARVLANLEF